MDQPTDIASFRILAHSQKFITEHGQSEVEIAEQTDEWTNIRTNGWTIGGTNGWTNGETDRWRYQQMDHRTDTHCYEVTSHRKCMSWVLNSYLSCSLQTLSIQTVLRGFVTQKGSFVIAFLIIDSLVLILSAFGPALALKQRLQNRAAFFDVSILL